MATASVVSVQSIQFTNVLVCYNLTLPSIKFICNTVVENMHALFIETKKPQW